MRAVCALTIVFAVLGSSVPALAHSSRGRTTHRAHRHHPAKPPQLVIKMAPGVYLYRPSTGVFIDGAERAGTRIVLKAGDQVQNWSTGNVVISDQYGYFEVFQDSQVITSAPTSVTSAIVLVEGTVRSRENVSSTRSRRRIVGTSATKTYSTGTVRVTPEVSEFLVSRKWETVDSTTGYFARMKWVRGTAEGTWRGTTYRLSSSTQNQGPFQDP